MFLVCDESIKLGSSYVNVFVSTIGFVDGLILGINRVPELGSLVTCFNVSTYHNIEGSFIRYLIGLYDGTKLCASGGYFDDKNMKNLMDQY